MTQPPPYDDAETLLALQQPAASRRKLRLLGCAFCRRHLGALAGTTAELLLEVSEDFAAGRVGEQQLLQAHGQAWRHYQLQDDLQRKAERQRAQARRARLRNEEPQADWRAARLLQQAERQLPLRHLWRALWEVTRVNDIALGVEEARLLTYYAADSEQLERRAQCELIVEVFGAGQQPCTTEAFADWRSRLTVQALAGSIYDERQFADLPILADVIEEAGCTDAHILGHLRGGGEHVKGCWVLDGILGWG